MRKTKATLLLADEGSINLEAWLQHVVSKHDLKENDLIRQACTLAQVTGSEHAIPTGQSCLQQGLNMAEILAELNLDQETLAAAIVYSSVRYADLNIEDVAEQLGDAVAKLVLGTKKMDAMDTMHEQLGQHSQSATIDNLRKMLLAMVDDVRVVLIKLAERLAILRNIALLGEEEKKREAEITRDLYAPLANRLGIGHIKWELEDFAFRYLDPNTYKNISKALNSTRVERETYVVKVMQSLKEAVHGLGIAKVEVTGRAKHIYSIHRKMQRKNVSLDEIYDAIAFRVLVPTIADCYAVLGHVHALWKPIRKEFDDYIAQPKPNGYRSIHTAVFGPDDKKMEIQIRTFDMHQESELGVAAHWMYKEGRRAMTGYEAKIAWLRQVMDWQREVTESDQKSEEIYSKIFDDRIYVFTPNGDVIELPKEATPLDFAYQIHSELGHRTRGAKINGHMVTLTHPLKTGECVEILTTKQAHPSRDWLNPHLGYLKTSRAKAKVLNWFRKQDFDKNLAEGQAILEKELRRLGLLKNVNYEQLAQQINYKTGDDLLAGLGRGDVQLGTIISAIQETIAPKVEVEKEIITEPTNLIKHKPAQTPTDIEVEGVGNLLTHMAQCCKPIPGDAVIGYITQTQGVSIHRQDCSNILHVSEQQKDRLIQVGWGTKTHDKYAVDLVVNAYDRPGLVRDISNLLANENISILGLTCVTNKKDHTAYINITIEIHSLHPLSRILAHINQLPNITEVKRL